jgi:hydrogenase nickel incorporation protein HypB
MQYLPNQWLALARRAHRFQPKIVHELGIMESAIEVVQRYAAEKHARRVERIVLRIGTLAGVDRDSLRFAFDVVSKGTAAEGATLDIEPYRPRSTARAASASSPARTAVSSSPARPAATFAARSAAAARLSSVTSNSPETMNEEPIVTHEEAGDGYGVHPLSGAAARPASTLSAPLSAEINAALSASPKGEVAVRSLDLRIPLLEKNDILAERNRGYFLGRGLSALNLVSSPGAGKTTLLERTLDEFALTTKCAVLVGDLETDNDGNRLRRPHVPVAQITTGTVCHLDAGMIARAVQSIELAGVRVLFIENVGNLVCPASFDLGEQVRVVLLSTTEGEDKPLKYPPIFKSANLVLLTKVDLADALGFKRDVALQNVRRIAPQARVIEISARSGEGVQEWYAFLRSLSPAP